jgi:hypothetical protein
VSETNLLLLFVNVTDLKPNVDFCQGSRWVVKNVLEALQGVVGVFLLLVNDAQPKVDLVGLFKV